MTEKDWKLLLCLYEEGTITKAAERLYISQPALTYRIKQIEKEFNTQIIHRGNKGVVFTYQGEQLVKYAKIILNQLRKLKDTLENSEDEICGTLRLGVSSNFALYRLPALLEGFLQKYPKVEIQLKTGWSSEVYNHLQREEVYVAILRGEHSWSGPYVTLQQEKLCVTSRRPIDLEDLPNQNMIRYKTDVGLKSIFDKWWQSNFNVPPKVLMEVDRIETCKELVKKGLGYSLFPSICLKEEDQLFTKDMNIGDQQILRKTSMLYREDFLHLKVVSVFVNYVKNYYQKMEH